MDTVKSKSLRNLEERMKDIDENSLRHHVLESAKNFKTSWIELGRSLYSVWKNKHYREWGYSTFDIYTVKEIGIRKQTALKLLRSYYFLEKEEPQYLKESNSESQDAARLPSYEAIDVLRLAKNKKTLDNSDYDNLKKEIFDKGVDARQLRRDLTNIIRQRQELEPQEAFRKKRASGIRRFLGTLKALKQELQVEKLVSSSLIKEAEDLIRKLEKELNED